MKGQALRRRYSWQRAGGTQSRDRRGGAAEELIPCPRRTKRLNPKWCLFSFARAEPLRATLRYVTIRGYICAATPTSPTNTPSSTRKSTASPKLLEPPAIMRARKAST